MNNFSLEPFSFSNNLLVTFFSAARTIPFLWGKGYFFSLSAFASSSFFFVAAEVVVVLVEVEGSVEEESTAMASVDSDEAVKGFADGPAARIPTTVPAWPVRNGVVQLG